VCLRPGPLYGRTPADPATARGLLGIGKAAS